MHLWQARPSIHGEWPECIGQAGDSGIGQVATVPLGQVTRGGRGRGCDAPAEARGDEGAGGELVTLPNAAFQMFDVVTVSDARAGCRSGVCRLCS